MYKKFGYLGKKIILHKNQMRYDFLFEFWGYLYKINKKMRKANKI